MKSYLQEAISLIREHRKQFILLNLAFFGLFLLTMIVTVSMPELQPPVVEILSRIVRTDLAEKVYLTGNIFVAASATLAVNLGVAALLISLPSLIVPFFGVAFSLLFAAIYGITLAPIGPYAAAMIPHSVAILIEFEAYILASFGAYLFGRTVFSPSEQTNTLGRRYLTGAAKLASLYTLIIPLLALGALYEVFEIFFLVRYFV